MSLSLNQFSMAPVQGMMDLEIPGTVISCAVDAAQVLDLVAGQAVKLATTAGGVPAVLAVASNADPVFGFVARNQKDASFPAQAPLEIALNGSGMFMTANAAITRGAAVELDYANKKVAPWGGVNPVIGRALDAAAANNDLIRVYVSGAFPAGENATSKTVTVTATLAEINAGKVLIPAIPGKQITLTNYVARVTGGFTTGTAVILESTNGAPVLASTIAEAGLTNGAILLPSSANTTLGAGFGAAMGLGDGLQVVNSGAAQAAGTSILFTLTYKQA